MGRGSSKRVARRVAVKEWRAEALRLRANGWTIPQLAKRFDKAISTVHEAIEKELAALPAEPAKHLRTIHGAQLDAVIRANLKKVRLGDTRASLAVVHAIQAKAKLFGLNASEKVEATLTLTTDAHEDLLQRLAKLAGAGPTPDETK